MREAGRLTSMREFRQAGISVRLAVGGAVLGALALLAALISLSLGPVNIPASHVAAIVLSFIGLETAEVGRTEHLVIEQIRLPRILVGAFVGMALAVAGATMQGLFRNPMADPGIIGVSAGGALGAVIAIATGLTGRLLPGPADVRLRWRRIGDVSRLRHRRRWRALLHGHAAAGRRCGQRLLGRGGVRDHHSACPTTKRCARSCSGWRAASIREPGTTSTSRLR